jgi:hypothetical protein
MSVGSVADYLINHMNIPVLLVRGHEESPPRAQEIRRGHGREAAEPGADVTLAAALRRETPPRRTARYALAAARTPSAP